MKAYIKVRDVNSLEVANNAILLESDARDFMLNCMSKLVDALIELNGDESDNIINEAEEILNQK